MRPTNADNSASLPPASMKARRLKSLWRSLSLSILVLLKKGLLPTQEHPGNRRETAKRHQILEECRVGSNRRHVVNRDQYPACQSRASRHQGEAQPHDGKRLAGEKPLLRAHNAMNAEKHDRADSDRDAGQDILQYPDDEDRIGRHQLRPVYGPVMDGH